MLANRSNRERARVRDELKGSHYAVRTLSVRLESRWQIVKPGIGIAQKQNPRQSGDVLRSSRHLCTHPSIPRARPCVVAHLAKYCERTRAIANTLKSVDTRRRPFSASGSSRAGFRA